MLTCSPTPSRVKKVGDEELVESFSEQLPMFIHESERTYLRAGPRAVEDGQDRVNKSPETFANDDPEIVWHGPTHGEPDPSECFGMLCPHEVGLRIGNSLMHGFRPGVERLSEIL